MATEALKMMKEQLMSCVQGQLGDLSKVDAHELGEAVDMIKDLAEAIYYCTITDSMEKSTEDKGQQPQGDTNINYYTTTPQMTPMPTYYGGGRGYMYYPGGGNGGQGGTNYYTELPGEMRRDPRQGRAYMRRRMYMEGKEMHNDPKSQLKELEAYLQELSTDVTQMIKDASPEERATLRQKMTTLANQIV